MTYKLFRCMVLTGMIAVGSIAGYGLNEAKADCRTALSIAIEQGIIIGNGLDGDAAMIKVDSYYWKRMTYTQKIGMANCMKKYRHVKKVYINNDRNKLIGVWDGRTLKQY